MKNIELGVKNKKTITVIDKMIFTGASFVWDPERKEMILQMEGRILKSHKEKISK